VNYGSLATLRHGFKCYGRTLRVTFFKAAHGLNPQLVSRYAARFILEVTNGSGVIKEANLTLAGHLGVERGHLIASPLLEIHTHRGRRKIPPSSA
jgi:hypothetical protein